MVIISSLPLFTSYVNQPGILRLGDDVKNAGKIRASALVWEVQMSISRKSLILICSVQNFFVPLPTDAEILANLTAS